MGSNWILTCPFSPTLPCIGPHPYTEQLWALHRHRPYLSRPVPPELTGCTSPLRWQDWDTALADHPDRQFAEYVVCGIRHGFRIGFDYSSHTCVSARRNIQSASDHPRVVHDYLAGESAAGRILGPFPPVSLDGVQVSPLGVVPKKGRNKWSLILDLSSPEGHSVNDAISRDLCSLSYISVDDTARAVTRIGRGALLAKVDIKSTYRIAEEHPEDRLILGMIFEGLLYDDSVLPFGLR